MEDFSKIVSDMKLHGMKVQHERVFLKIPYAREITEQGLAHFIAAEGKKAVWLEEYDQIVEWLEDNKGLGLLLHGKCGVGKTIMGRYVIPAILLLKLRKVVTCFDVGELNNMTDVVLSKKIISIDDVGTEEISIKYGEKRLAFAELMDMVEKQSKLIIITTNLTAEQITAKYGDRIMDRIKATTKRIAFNGQSFRK
jgi:DNA replication protein DnaC